MIKNVIVSVFLFAFSVLAHAVVIQGETAPGVYTNIKSDANGYLYAFSPVQGIVVNKSGTIAAASTSQTLAVANTARKYIFIQNVSSGDLWINFTGAATIGQPSIQLTPGSRFVMEIGFVSTEQINIIGATLGQAYTVKEY